ncbi:hypothetical protein [Streptomyces sp. NPDC097610]|uniref:hypothetical protein n=1 Tax=Streptomyces sp. NPDC097610 TaxID=3157227 RepID=UPI00331C5DFE
MPLLPLTVLPYIPAVFAPSDRLTYAGKTYVRNESGAWESPGLPSVTDAEVRVVYVDPQHLAVFGVPLVFPAPIAAGERLPGRKVAEGENPFEDRPYLMAGQLGGVFMAFGSDGPWGTAQRACTPDMPEGPAVFDYEMTVTDSGRVWFRAFGIPLVYVPADLPDESEVPPLIEAAALRLGFAPAPWH